MYGAPRFSGGVWSPAYRCGANMTGKGCYPRMVTEKVMVDLLAKVLHNVFLNPTERARLLAEMERQRADQPGKDEAKGSLRAKVAKLEGQIKTASRNLTLIEDEADVREANAQLKDWRSQLAAAKRELDRLSQAAEGASPESLIGRVEKLVEVLQTASPAELSPVIQQSLDHVNLEFDTVPKAKKVMHPLVGGVAHLRGNVDLAPSGPAMGR
jgi:hypothetical protein